MWGTKPFGEQLRELLSALGAYFADKDIPGARSLGIAVIAFLLTALVLSFRMSAVRKLLLLLSAAVMLISPVALCVMMGTKMPYRTLLGLMTLSGALWFLVTGGISHRVLRTAAVIGASLILWNQTVQLNRLFYGGYLCSELDRTMGFEIAEKVICASGTRNPEQAVVFVGRYQHKSPNIIYLDAVGQSIFFRNRSLYRIHYLQHLGFHFKHSNEEQQKIAEAYAENMPIWPLEGCVQAYDDIIVVRLS